MSCEGVGPGGCVCGVTVDERSVDVEEYRVIASSERCFAKGVHPSSVAIEPNHLDQFRTTVEHEVGSMMSLVPRTDGLKRRLRRKELLQFPRVLQSCAGGGVVEDAPHIS